MCCWITALLRSMSYEQPAEQPQQQPNDSVVTPPVFSRDHVPGSTYVPPSFTHMQASPPIPIPQSALNPTVTLAAPRPLTYSPFLQPVIVTDHTIPDSFTDEEATRSLHDFNNDRLTESFRSMAVLAVTCNRIRTEIQGLTGDDYSKKYQELMTAGENYELAVTRHTEISAMVNAGVF